MVDGEPKLAGVYDPRQCSAAEPAFACVDASISHLLDTELYAQLLRLSDQPPVVVTNDSV